MDQSHTIMADKAGWIMPALLPTFLCALSYKDCHLSSLGFRYISVRQNVKILLGLLIKI